MASLCVGFHSVYRLSDCARANGGVFDCSNWSCVTTCVATIDNAPTLAGLEQVVNVAYARLDVDGDGCAAKTEFVSLIGEILALHAWTLPARPSISVAAMVVAAK
eukprot:COSAG02_NODE_1041_length_15034_cov_96.398326_7_plen_105_part_00